MCFSNCFSTKQEAERRREELPLLEANDSPFCFDVSSSRAELASESCLRHSKNGSRALPGLSSFSCLSRALQCALNTLSDHKQFSNLAEACQCALSSGPRRSLAFSRKVYEFHVLPRSSRRRTKEEKRTCREVASPATFGGF